MSNEKQQEVPVKAEIRKPLVLCGITVDELPPAPWTFRALGRERYYALAAYGGYLTGQEPATYTPDLNPRNFAQGIAWKRVFDSLTIDARLPLAERHQVVSDILDGRMKDEQLREVCAVEAFEAVKAIVSEANQLQELLDAKLGESQPTARNATALSFAQQRDKQR